MKIDTDILKKCLKGDELACKKLYGKFLPYCYGICRRYGVSEIEIKDQIQIIFSNTFRSLKTFDAQKASFKTWFTRICINKILEQRRSYKNQILISELNESELNFGYDDSERLNAKLDLEYILKLLENMPDHYRAVFNLFIIDEYSHKEIGETLNISEGSSRAILKRARTWAQRELINFIELS